MSISRLLLDKIYQCYEESGTFNQDAVQEKFNCLNRTLSDGGVQDVNPIIEAICDLCTVSQKEGFIAGIKAGFDLARELNW